MIVHVKNNADSTFRNEIQYILKILGINKTVTFSESEQGLEIGTSESAVIRLSDRFISNYSQKKFSASENLNDKGFIELSNGEPDYLSTAFYMVACLQEYDPALPVDVLGRFEYQNSYQAKLKLSNKNIVQHCFDKLAECFRLPSHSIQSKFFLSHDIDTVNQSIFQDGFHVLKKGRIDIFLKLLLNVAIGKTRLVEHGPDHEHGKRI